MNSVNDQQLLREYTERRSETAFAELVRRNVDLVYSAALRLVRDAHLAEDVTQGVFLALAQNAGQLAGRPVLSGWLHGTTRNLAANAVRSEVRRHAREQEAAAMNELLAAEPDANWQHIAPHLDAALGELSESDREVLLLRYFKNQSLREVGQTLGTSEDAAQKRVSRAMDQLRGFLVKRGVAVGTSGLAVAMAANAVQAAPVGLAAALSSAVFSSAAAAAGTATILKTMALTKLQMGVIGTVVIAGALTSLVIQQSSLAKTRHADGALQQQSVRLAQVQSEHDRLANLAEWLTLPRANTQAELRRLRDEVAALRKQTNTLVALRNEDRQLQASLGKAREDALNPNVQPVLPSEETATRTRYSLRLGLAAIEYATDHQSQFPTNLASAMTYLSAADKAQTNLTAAQFEIVYTETRAALAKYAHPEQILLIRERQRWKNAQGQWVKAYVFSDGHGEMISSADGDFETWEKQHIVSSDPTNP